MIDFSPPAFVSFLSFPVRAVSLHYMFIMHLFYLRTIKNHFQSFLSHCVSCKPFWERKLPYYKAIFLKISVLLASRQKFKWCEGKKETTFVLHFSWIVLSIFKGLLSFMLLFFAQPGSSRTYIALSYKEDHRELVKPPTGKICPTFSSVDSSSCLNTCLFGSQRWVCTTITWKVWDTHISWPSPITSGQ